jgi:hypothetical protein
MTTQMTATQTARYYEREIKKTFGLGNAHAFVKVLRGNEARDWLGHSEFRGALLISEYSGECCGLMETINGCGSHPTPWVEAPEGAAFHEFENQSVAIFYDETAPDEAEDAA